MIDGDRIDVAILKVFHPQSNPNLATPSLEIHTSESPETANPQTALNVDIESKKEDSPGAKPKREVRRRTAKKGVRGKSKRGREGKKSKSN